MAGKWSGASPDQPRCPSRWRFVCWRWATTRCCPRDRRSCSRSCRRSGCGRAAQFWSAASATQQKRRALNICPEQNKRFWDWETAKPGSDLLGRRKHNSHERWFAWIYLWVCQISRSRSTGVDWLLSGTESHDVLLFHRRQNRRLVCYQVSSHWAIFIFKSGCIHN